MPVRSSLRGLLPLVVLLSFTPLAARAEEDAATPRVQGMAVAMDIVRNTSIGGGFLCSAQVTDGLSGDVLAAPTLQLAPGGRSLSRVFRHAEAGRPTTEVVVEVSSNKTGDTVTYNVSYSRAGELVGIQRSSMAIR